MEEQIKNKNISESNISEIKKATEEWLEVAYKALLDEPYMERDYDFYRGEVQGLESAQIEDGLDRNEIKAIEKRVEAEYIRENAPSGWGVESAYQDMLAVVKEKIEIYKNFVDTSTENKDFVKSSLYAYRTMEKWLKEQINTMEEYRIK